MTEARVMIEQHKRRPYIENLRRDHRTKALFDSWVAQGTMLAEQRNCGDWGDYRRMAHDAASEALALAMAFILDNDGEYQMVCEERDRLREAVLKAAHLRPATTYFAQGTSASGQDPQGLEAKPAGPVA